LGLALVAVAWLSVVRVEPAARGALKDAADAIGWLVLMLLASLLLLQLAAGRRAARRLWPAAAVGLIVLDLFSIAPDANLEDRRPGDAYRASAAVRRLQRQTNRLYRLPGGPGRAWLAARAIVVPDAGASLQAALADGFDLRRDVALEGATEGATAAAGTPGGAPGEAQILDVGWSRVAVR